MDDAYSQETLALAEDVDRYARMDVYDTERPKLVGVSACSRHLRTGAGQFHMTGLSSSQQCLTKRDGVLSRVHAEMQPSVFAMRLSGI